MQVHVLSQKQESPRRKRPGRVIIVYFSFLFDRLETNLDKGGEDDISNLFIW